MGQQERETWLKGSEEVRSWGWKLEMAEKQDTEESSQGNLGHRGKASLACVGNRLRVWEQERLQKTSEGEKGRGCTGVWHVEAGTGTSGRRREV